MKFKNVLITGGAGYCGSVLTPQLLDMGHRVTVYDILYYGSDFLPLGNPNLKVVEGDIRNVQRLTRELDGRTCELVDKNRQLEEEIALSKLLAWRAGAPLPTLFIDEGFGTQDVEGRDRILDVIKAIEDRFQRILVITHLEEIKDAFPVRIEVTRTAAAGSTFSLS